MRKYQQNRIYKKNNEKSNNKKKMAGDGHEPEKQYHEKKQKTIPQSK